ncbi:MAG: T9SS type A sorting domain-containing protein [bacterium]
MKKSFILYYLVIFAGNIYSCTWTRTIGGSGNDYGYSMCFAQDTGYILTGCTDSYGAGETDAWLIKTDTFGVMQWSKAFGGADSDGVYSVQKTADSGYIAVGYTKSFGVGESNIWFIKTDINGDTVWTRAYGDSGEYAYSYSTTNTTDSSYVAVGTRNSGKDVWLIKVDSNGDTLWTRTFKDYGYGRCVQQTRDSGYIITGYSSSLVAGITVSYLIKTNANGDTMWTKTFGNGYLYSVIETKDNRYAMIGNYGYSGYRICFIKTDSAGEIISNFYLDNFYGIGRSIAEINDTNYVIVGLGGCTTPNQATILNFSYFYYSNPFGYYECFTGKYSSDAYSFVQVSGSAYVLVGYTNSYGRGKNDLWLIRTEKNTWDACMFFTGIEETSSNKNYFPSVSISPNPFIRSTVISFELPALTANQCPLTTLRLYDISGREKMTLFNGNAKAKNVITLNASSLSSGRYFLRMETGSESIVKELTIFK